MHSDWSTVCLCEIASSISIGSLGSIFIDVQCVPVEISIQITFWLHWKALSKVEPGGVWKKKMQRRRKIIRRIIRIIIRRRIRIIIRRLTLPSPRTLHWLSASKVKKDLPYGCAFIQHSGSILPFVFFPWIPSFLLSIWRSFQALVLWWMCA